MSAITTHVLDTARGCAAVGISACLFKWQGSRWITLSTADTDQDGRVADWPDAEALEVGRYRLSFDVEAYFDTEGLPVFFPSVDIEFLVLDPAEHYHVPLLISPYSYSTYRGS